MWGSRCWGSSAPPTFNLNAHSQVVGRFCNTHNQISRFRVGLGWLPVAWDTAMPSHLSLIHRLKDLTDAQPWIGCSKNPSVAFFRPKICHQEMSWTQNASHSTQELLRSTDPTQIWWQCSSSWPHTSCARQSPLFGIFIPGIIAVKISIFKGGCSKTFTTHDFVINLKCGFFNYFATPTMNGSCFIQTQLNRSLREAGNGIDSTSFQEMEEKISTSWLFCIFFIWYRW